MSAHIAQQMFHRRGSKVSDGSEAFQNLKRSAFKEIINYIQTLQKHALNRKTGFLAANYDVVHLKRTSEKNS